MTIALPDMLIPKISQAAKDEGFDKVDDFVAQTLEEKLRALEHKRKFFEVSDRVRAALEKKGISEEEILADFEKFRDKLYLERTK